ncbi:hypothetical protein BDD12DRAFT_941848 [Trichophaea hybrida]|nr:hypothetical protein BDD12DRAFT_941848 [Trichophaea hybrida]
MTASTREIDLSKLSPTALEAEANQPSPAASASASRIKLQARLLSLRAQRPVSSICPTISTSPSTSPNASQVSTIPDAGRTPSDETPSLDAQILSFALSRGKALTDHTLHNLYRIAGITTFAAQEITGEKLFGIRIDVFSARERKFGKPVYIMLENKVVEKGGSKVWIVARHSAGAFLGVAELAGRYLHGGKGVGVFLKEVRRRVLRWRRRVDVAEGVREAAMAAGGEGWVERVERVGWDEGVASVVMKWVDGEEAHCRIDEKGGLWVRLSRGRRGRG